MLPPSSPSFQHVGFSKHPVMQRDKKKKKIFKKTCLILLQMMVLGGRGVKCKTGHIPTRYNKWTRPRGCKGNKPRFTPATWINSGPKRIFFSSFFTLINQHSHQLTHIWQINAAWWCQLRRNRDADYQMILIKVAVTELSWLPQTCWNSWPYMGRKCRQGGGKEKKRKRDLSGSVTENCTQLLRADFAKWSNNFHMVSSGFEIQLDPGIKTFLSFLWLKKYI